jgi:hypothetical protein
MTTFKSKIGLEFVIPVFTLLTVLFFVMLYNRVWVGLLIILVSSAFIIHLFLTTRYTIDKKALVIRQGFFIKIEVDIQKIRKISSTDIALSSPATSIDRLEIVYNNFDSVIISPKDKSGFVEHLKKINPDIDVRRMKT